MHALFALLVVVILLTALAVAVFAKEPPTLLAILGRAATENPIPSVIFVVVALLVAVGAVKSLARTQPVVTTECERESTRIAAAIAADDFGQARKNVAAARKVCSEEEVAARLESWERDIANAETSYPERAAAQAAAQEAQRRAEEEAAQLRAREKAEAAERDALARFDGAILDVRRDLREADGFVSVQMWEQAGAALDRARTRLDSFNETSPATTKEWKDANAAALDRERRVRPQVERIVKKRQIEEAIRGPKPEMGYAQIPAGVMTYLTHRAHDPESIDIERCTEPTIEGLFWTTTCAYRGKNAFGALVLNASTFFIQRGEVHHQAEAR